MLMARREIGGRMAVAARRAGGVISAQAEIQFNFMARSPFAETTLNVRNAKKSYCYTDGIAFSAGNHWPINVGGHGTDMKWSNTR